MCLCVSTSMFSCFFLSKCLCCSNCLLFDCLVAPLWLQPLHQMYRFQRNITPLLVSLYKNRAYADATTWLQSQKCLNRSTATSKLTESNPNPEYSREPCVFQRCGYISCFFFQTRLTLELRFPLGKHNARPLIRSKVWSNLYKKRTPKASFGTGGASTERLVREENAPARTPHHRALQAFFLWKGKRKIKPILSYN